MVLAWMAHVAPTVLAQVALHAVFFAIATIASSLLLPLLLTIRLFGAVVSSIRCAGRTGGGRTSGQTSLSANHAVVIVGSDTCEGAGLVRFYAEQPSGPTVFVCGAASDRLHDMCDALPTTKIVRLSSIGAPASHKSGGGASTSAPIASVEVDSGRILDAVTASGKQLHTVLLVAAEPPAKSSESRSTATPVDTISASDLLSRHDGFARALGRVHVLSRIVGSLLPLLVATARARTTVVRPRVVLVSRHMPGRLHPFAAATSTTLPHQTTHHDHAGTLFESAMASTLLRELDRASIASGVVGFWRVAVPPDVLDPSYLTTRHPPPGTAEEPASLDATTSSVGGSSPGSPGGRASAGSIQRRRRQEQEERALGQELGPATAQPYGPSYAPDGAGGCVVLPASAVGRFLALLSTPRWIHAAVPQAFGLQRRVLGVLDA